MRKPFFAAAALKALRCVLFPGACGICRRRSEAGICESCDEALETAALSEPLFTVNADDVAIQCAACFIYDGRDSGERLLFELKRNSGRAMVNYCAGRISFAVCALGISGKAIFTGVPRSASGMRKNGFDQAQLLASRAAALSENGEYLRLLKRRGLSSEQKMLDRNQRKENIKGKFKIRTLCGLSPEYDGNIVIFDDVCTTGASVAECAGVISNAFPKAKVYAVFLARTEGER